VHERPGSPKYSLKHKSKSCHKSKRDRARSRSKELKGLDIRYEEPKNNSPDRKVLLESSKKDSLENQPDFVEKKEKVIVGEQKLPIIPKYYNAKTVNPLKIATQEEKRKLLWGDAKKVYTIKTLFIIY